MKVQVTGNDEQLLLSSTDNSLIRGMGWQPAWTLKGGLRECAIIYSAGV